MAGMYDQFKTDASLEAEGIWLDYGPFRVRVARAGGGNKKFEKLMAAKVAPYKRAIATETLSDEISNKVLMEAYAEAVIIAWEVRDEQADVSGGESQWVSGIEAEDGHVMPFNPENVIKTLKALPDLYIDIRAQASKAALFLRSIRENDSKN